MTKTDVEAVAGIVTEAIDVLAGMSAESNRKLVALAMEKVVKPLGDELVKVVYSVEYEKAWCDHVRRLRDILMSIGFSNEEAFAFVLEKVAAENAVWRSVGRGVGTVKK